MLKFVTGYSKNMIDAKERAIIFYDKAEGKKVFKTVETQYGRNEIDEPVYVTTIWFEIFEITESQESEKHLFIGSSDIDPNDPDWLQKWNDQQDALKEQSLDAEEYPEHALQGT